MKKELVATLICPMCRSRALSLTVFKENRAHDIVEGVVRCTHCHRWYPIYDSILEFLPDSLAYWDDRAQFFTQHKKVLKHLRIAPPTNSKNEKLGKFQQSYFDWYAVNSTQSYSEYANSPFWKATDKMIFGLWKPIIPKKSWLLDVGCAQGRSSFQMADLPITIVGFDISKNMIKQAIQRSRSSTHKANMIFFVADASSFPLASESFDTILLYGVLHHLPDPAKTVSQIMRVLRPGGIYFGLENNKTPVRSVFELMQRLHPLWYEEAGAMPLISSDDIYGWLNGIHVQRSVSYHTFLPPHLINLLPDKLATAVVWATDTMGQRLPYVRQYGGLIRIVAQKS